VAELINIASDENVKLVGIHSSEFRLQSKMEKKVSFQALQANELIKFLPKKEVFAQKKKGGGEFEMQKGQNLLQCMKIEK
jgi:hypothetical protein